MRGGSRLALALPAALLLATGCFGGSGDEPVDEMGTNKPGSAGEEGVRDPRGLGAGTEDAPEGRSGTLGPPEGYRSREEVLQQTPATQEPGSPGREAPEPGASERAGMEMEEGEAEPKTPAEPQSGAR